MGLNSFTALCTTPRSTLTFSPRLLRPVITPAQTRRRHQGREGCHDGRPCRRQGSHASEGRRAQEEAGLLRVVLRFISGRQPQELRAGRAPRSLLMLDLPSCCWSPPFATLTPTAAPHLILLSIGISRRYSCRKLDLSPAIFSAQDEEKKDAGGYAAQMSRAINDALLRGSGSEGRRVSDSKSKVRRPRTDGRRTYILVVEFGKEIVLRG